MVHAAELKGIPPKEITGNYEKVEAKILRQFFRFVQEHEGAIWVHWHMRSTDYGFQALNHRASILKLSPVNIEDSRTISLPNLLRDLEGDGYIGDPHLSKLLDKNDIRTLEFREGEEEATAFTQGDYLTLHRSALSKVEALYKLAEFAASESLRTDARWWTRHGLTSRDIAWALSDHWSFNIVMALLAVAGVGWGVAQSF